MCDLYGQFLSSLCTSCSQHLSSARSAHPGPESMNFRMGTLFRLKCHFHMEKHLLLIETWHVLFKKIA